MTTTSAKEPATTENDEQALAMRRKGRSFSGIAKELGYERAHDANDAFNRALRQRPPAEQDELRQEEQRRLDVMTQRVQEDDTLDKDEVAKRLRAIDHLRRVLAAD